MKEEDWLFQFCLVQWSEVVSKILLAIFVAEIKHYCCFVRILFRKNNRQVIFRKTFPE